MSAAMTGEWLVWAEFVDRAHRDLVRSAPPSRDAAKRATAWAEKTRAEIIASETPEGRESLRVIAAQSNARIRAWPEAQAKAYAAAGIPISNAGAPCTAQEAAQAEIDKFERWYAMSAEDRAPTVEALVKLRLRELTEVRDALGAWRACRDLVLGELAELGLAATVARTDEDVPLGDHEADLSGLVRVHQPGREPPTPRGWLDATQTAYAARMYQHGLTPCDGLPRSLRRFCGQFVEQAYRSVYDQAVVQANAGAPWMDHTYTWLDAGGLPVLTTEPYAFDPAAVALELAVLPLDVEVLPGVWNDGTTLIVFRWDCDKPPLEAELKLLVDRFDHKTREWVRDYA